MEGFILARPVKKAWRCDRFALYPADDLDVAMKTFKAQLPDHSLVGFFKTTNDPEALTSDFFFPYCIPCFVAPFLSKNIAICMILRTLVNAE